MTLIAWGNQANRPLGHCRLQVNRMLRAAELAQEHGISCEVIDLQPGTWRSPVLLMVEGQFYWKAAFRARFQALGTDFCA